MAEILFSNGRIPLMAFGRTGILNTGLKFIRNFTLGQGALPVRVTGYDDQGNEKLEKFDPLARISKSKIIRIN